MKTTPGRDSLVASALLLAVFVWTSGCVRPSQANPLNGWKSCRGEQIHEIISEDYQDYIQSLSAAERSSVRGYNIRFFEDGKGRHAVRISIPLEGVWREHALIYDKDDRRIKVIDYTSGRYGS